MHGIRDKKNDGWIEMEQWTVCKTYGSTLEKWTVMTQRFKGRYENINPIEVLLEEWGSDGIQHTYQHILSVPLSVFMVAIAVESDSPTVRDNVATRVVGRPMYGTHVIAINDQYGLHGLSRTGINELEWYAGWVHPETRWFRPGFEMVSQGAT